MFVEFTKSPTETICVNVLHIKYIEKCEPNRTILNFQPSYNDEEFFITVNESYTEVCQKLQEAISQ